MTLEKINCPGVVQLEFPDFILCLSQDEINSIDRDFIEVKIDRKRKQFRLTQHHLNQIKNLKKKRRYSSSSDSEELEIEDEDVLKYFDDVPVKKRYSDNDELIYKRDYDFYDVAAFQEKMLDKMSDIDYNFNSDPRLLITHISSHQKLKDDKIVQAFREFLYEKNDETIDDLGENMFKRV